MAFVKKAIFAVAGAGKTTMLVNSLSLTKRTLLLTYTDNNARQLSEAVVKKYGFFPDSIMVSTWFSFVLNFMIKPFVIIPAPSISRLLFPKNGAPRYVKGIQRYTTDDGGVFHSRAFEFVTKYVGKDKIRNRLQKFFDEVLIDEVQDFAGYDFDFIELLGSVDVNVVITGDFFQHTYDTSRDGSKNKNLHGDFKVYKKRLTRFYSIDETSLSRSYRCPAEICNFVSSSIGIKMDSASSVNDVAPPILVLDRQAIQSIMENDSIKKLFRQECYKYNCNSSNWGDCKGLSYDNVSVILNPKSATLFKNRRLAELSQITRNKLYVACTRTKGDLCFIEETNLVDYRRVEA